MDTEPLDAVPLWGVFTATILLAWLGLEVGYRIGRWRHDHVTEEKETPVGAMVGSILGLLAIMLAFAFNLAATRFDARRQAVLEEANAIGTTYLRARLLPEPQRSEIAGLLREYVDLRVQMVRTGNLSDALTRSEDLQEKLWSRGVAVAEKAPSSIMTGLFLQSLNEVIDLHAKRVLVGLRSRLPFAIWFALFALSLIGMSSMGYQAGLAATRRTPAMMLLALAFASILLLVVDLDRAHEGLLRVSQEAMFDLQRSMQAPP